MVTKVAAIQMCSSHDVDENLDSAEKLIRDAAAQNAHLVVLPENFALMPLESEDRLKDQEPMGQGKIQQFLSHMTRENQLWLVGGTIPIASSNPQKVRAACLLYDDKGQLAGRYDKINLFDAIVSEKETHNESAIIEPGNDVVVLKMPFGKLGLAVCFDVRFPALFTQIATKGAEIIALPAAFTVPTGKAHWQILMQARAIDTFSYVIGAAQGGTHTNGRKTYGHSMIVDPWGMILAEKKDDQPGVVIAEIDLQRVHQYRNAIPVLPA